jgi:hypothetical protein
MKKVRIFVSIAIIAMAGITLNSCQKSESDLEPSAVDNQPQSNEHSRINNEVVKHAITAYMKDQQEKGNLKSGAQFIPAFFTSDGFGLGVDIVVDENFNFIGGEIAFFSTELDEDDFYRLNPDSTVSVHINSNTAAAQYIKFYPDFTSDLAWGENAHLTMNYTGAWLIFTFEFEGVTYTFQFVDAGSEPNAVVWHGAGKVQFDGTGPKHNLLARLIANQGWSNVKIDVNIN